MAAASDTRDRIFSVLRSARFLLPTAILISLFSLSYNLFSHVPTFTNSISNSHIVTSATTAFSSHKTSDIQNATLGVSNLLQIQNYD